MKNVKINRELIGENVIFSENCEIYDDFNIDYMSGSFVFGTVSDCKKMEYKNPCMNIRNFDFYNGLSVSSWLPFVKEEYINNDGYFKQSWQLNNDEIGKFCRLNSNDKYFRGFVVNDKNDLVKIKESTYEEDLIYITSVKSLFNINRYWVCNGEIIEYSDSGRNLNKEMIEYANKIIHQYFEPAIRYTIDIGVDLRDGSFKVIDYNCFGCSKFYNCDLNKIVKYI